MRPAGWLRQFLVNQRHGLTGHLEVAGYPFGIAGWALPEADNRSKVIWEPYEQDGYWLDGMVRCGLLLGDAWLIGKARYRIDRVIDEAAAESGYLGPILLREVAPAPDPFCCSIPPSSPSPAPNSRRLRPDGYREDVQQQSTPASRKVPRGEEV
jgi:hypothetical protein